MKPIARGELATFNGVVLTQEEHENYLKMQKDNRAFKKVFMRKFGFTKEELDECLMNPTKGIEHHETQEEIIKVVS